MAVEVDFTVLVNERRDMAYEVEIARPAVKALEKIEQPMRKSILDEIKTLEETPRPVGSELVTALSKERVFRFRVGDFRVLYQVFDKRLIVVVVRIANRRDVYDQRFLDEVRKYLRARK